MEGNRLMDEFMQALLRKPKRAGGGGIPSARCGETAKYGTGQNRRVRRAGAILHAEMDCLENADGSRLATTNDGTVLDPFSLRYLQRHSPALQYPHDSSENQTFQGP